ncbi:MAG: hypothetical protein ACPG4X_20375 [Pikeienuella sp.]
MNDLDSILSDDPIEDVTETDEPKADAIEADAPEAEKPAEVAEAEPDAPAEPAAEVVEDPRDKELAGLKAALSETRGEMRALKAANQPAPEPVPLPDVLDDPQGYNNHVADQMAQAVYQQKLDTSKFMAVEKYGQEAVDEAYAYFNDRPAETAAFAAHPSPFHAAVEAYQRNKVATEIGNDPEAFKAKLRAEIMAEINAQRVAENVAQVGNAPSLASEPNLGSRSTPAWSGPTPLNNLLG